MADITSHAPSEPIVPQAPSSTNESVENCNGTTSSDSNADGNGAAFKSCSTQLKAGEQKILVRLLLMNSASMLFINQSNTECLDELAVAMPARKVGHKMVSSSTTLIGKEHGSKSQRLAEQLTKRYGRQFFVSSNIQMDDFIWPLLERSLSEWLQKIHQRDEPKTTV